MSITRSQAAIVTRAYGEIFSYPLTREETRLWYVYHQVSRVSVGKRQSKLWKLRQKREAWSKKKWSIVARVVGWLRWIPTVMLIGVTGGLAMNNADRGDDIDLLIVTSPKTLWITRAWVTVVLEVLGVRRKRGHVNVANRICTNMYLATDGCAVPAGERDLYAAHEVLQMVPVFDRGGMYQRFLGANRWTKKFLPNAWEVRVKNEKVKVKSEKRIFPQFLIHYSLFIIRLFEPLAKILQLWYMKSRRTTEVISDTTVRFHPRDARVWVKDMLAKKLRPHHIPLDKTFYGS